MKGTRPIALALALLLAACSSRFDEELERARRLYEDGSPEEAVAVAVALAKSPPEEVEDRIRLAELLVVMGEGDRAVKLLERRDGLGAKGRDVLADAYFSTGDRARAGMMVREQLAAGEGTAATARIEGKLALARRDPGNAIRSLTKSLEEDPGVPETWIVLALAREMTGDADAAERMLREARGKFPDSPEVAIALAHLVLTRRGDDPAAREEARGLLTPAVAKRPRRYDERERLGILLREAGRLEEAERVLSELAEDVPGRASTHAALGTVRMARERIGEAVAAFRRAAELEPTSLEHALNLGNALLRLAERAADPKPAAGEAMEVFEAARRRVPSDPRPLVGIARSAVRADPKSDASATRARGLFEQALRMDPENADANLGIALLYYDTWAAGGRQDGEGARKARAHFERAAARVPPSEWPPAARAAFSSLTE